MNYRDIAIAMETEARVGRWQAVLAGAYQKFDNEITTRSNNPGMIAFWIFHNGSDRQVRQLAALWLYRHEKEVNFDEPEVSPDIAEAIESLYKPSSRQE